MLLLDDIHFILYWAVMSCRAAKIFYSINGRALVDQSSAKVS